MQVGKGNRILFLILLCLAVVFPGACTYKGGSGRVSEVQEFDSFFSTHSDSVVMAPRWMKAQALQRMERTKDSMVRRLPADNLFRIGWPICSPNVLI